jgi:TP901 family phage tail tape measure protein
VLNSLGLGLVFTAKDMATDTIGKMTGHFKQLEKAGGLAGAAASSGLSAAKIGLLSLGAGAATLAIGMKAAEKFTAFEFNLAAVGAVTKATTAELEMLRNAALEAGMKTEFSPTAAVEGLNTLTTAGQTAKEAVSTLVPVLDLAGASFGKLSVEGAAGAVVGTLNSFGMAASDSTVLVDKLVKTTNLTNFSFGDFEAGLSTAAASAGVFNQTLDDTLITMGLLRNRNIDASSSATALRESMRRLGSDAGAQKAVLAADVKIFDDLTGKMRPVLDITGDLIDKTKDWTEQKRNALVVDAFGARGLLAFASIQKASFTQSKNGIDVTLKGRDAIAAMRKEMSGAAGSAEEFRHALLDTYQGQLILLKGAKETAQILGGEAFAAVFKPIVSLAVSGINSLNRALQAVPKPVKAFVGQIVLGAGAFLSLVGTVLMVKSAMMLLGISLGGIAISFGKVLLVMLPVIATIGVLIGIFYALRQAYTQNVGGIADMLHNVFTKVRLGFRAIVQLFTDGGFSGAVRDELNEAGNSGIKKFAINLFLVVARIQNFFEGVVSGIKENIGSVAPAFESLKNAFFRLAEALGLTEGAIDHAAAKNSFDKWGNAGKTAGALIVDAIEIITKTITALTDIFTGLIKGWNKFWEGMTGDTELLKGLNTQFKDLKESLHSQTIEVESAKSGWTTFGEILSGTGLAALNAVIGVAYSLWDVLVGVMTILSGIGNLVGGALFDNWTRAWFGMKEIVFGVIFTIYKAMESVMKLVVGLADTIMRIFNVDIGASKLLSDLTAHRPVTENALRSTFGVTEADRVAADAFSPNFNDLGPQPNFSPAGPTPATAPAVAAAAGAPEPIMSGGGPVSSSAPQIVRATLVVDGRAIGELNASMGRSNADRSSLPVSMSSEG